MRKYCILTIFSCKFGRYRYARTVFGLEPKGDMFKRKIDESFREPPNVFGIVDEILIVG